MNRRGKVKREMKEKKDCEIFKIHFLSRRGVGRKPTSPVFCSAHEILGVGFWLAQFAMSA
jgi:hypothetical protein